MKNFKSLILYFWRLFLLEYLGIGGNCVVLHTKFWKKNSTRSLPTNNYLNFIHVVTNIIAWTIFFVAYYCKIEHENGHCVWNYTKKCNELYVDCQTPMHFSMIMVLQNNVRWEVRPRAWSFRVFYKTNVLFTILVRIFVNYPRNNSSYMYKYFCVTENCHCTLNNYFLKSNLVIYAVIT